MRYWLTWLVLLNGIVVLLVDYVVWQIFGEQYTITHTVRSWAAESSWPEILFAVGAVALWAHFFRNVL